MDFPKDEHQSLRARLAAGKPIYTTRISAERGRYEPGTDVSSPLGPLHVASLKSFKGLANHPFRGELTDSQRAELKGKMMDLLMLHKAASALVRLSRSSRGRYPSLGRTHDAFHTAAHAGTPEERELVLGAASRRHEPEKKASWVKDDLPWYTTAAGATAGTLAASRFMPKKYRAAGQIGGALLGTAVGLEGGKAVGRKLQKTAMALEMHKQASVDMYVDKSEDMDRGMFAERGFEPGEVLEIAPVLVVPRTQIRNSDVLRNYVFNFDKDNVMVALGYASMFNHSYSPNARYKKDKGSRTLTFTAIKPIKAGEEIFVNYNLDPDNKSPLWFDVKEKQTEKTAEDQKCLRAVLRLTEKNPDLKVMIGPPDKGYDTSHFWAEGSRGDIHDPTRSDYSNYGKGSNLNMKANRKFLSSLGEKTAEEDWKQKAKRWAPVVGGVAAGGTLAAGGLVAAHPALRAQALAEMRAVGKGGAYAVDRMSAIPEAAKGRIKQVAAGLRTMGIDPKKHRVGMSAVGGTGKSTLAKGLSEELGMASMNADASSTGYSGRKLMDYVKKKGFGPGVIAEQTHLTNQMNPDMLDYMVHMESAPAQVQKQLLDRGRSAGQSVLYDTDKLRKTIRSGFDLTEGEAKRLAPGVRVKKRPEGGFRAADRINVELGRRGIKPSGDRQKDLIALTQGSQPLLPGVLPLVSKKNVAIGGGAIGAGALAGGAAGNALATKEAAMREAFEEMA